MDKPGPSQIWPTQIQPTASNRKRCTTRREPEAAQSYKEPEIADEAEEAEALEENIQPKDAWDINARDEDA